MDKLFSGRNIRMGKNRATIFCLLALVAAAKSPAQTYNLLPVADTTLRAGSPNPNRGSEPTLQFVSGDSHILLRFDQPAIASAVGTGRLVSASLELIVRTAGNSWGVGGRPVEAHRLTTDWTEASATWNCAIDSQAASGGANFTAQWAGGTFEEDATDTAPQTSEERR